MEKLKYISSERYYEGTIIKITDGSVTIELKGRLGRINLTKRMIISEKTLKIGQKIGFLMTYPEVIYEN